MTYNSCQETRDKETGTIYSASRSESYTWTSQDSSCDASYTGDYEIEFGVSGVDDEWNYDVVHDWKYFYLKSYFTDLPENLVDHDCNLEDSYGNTQCYTSGCDETKPLSVEYFVRHDECCYELNDYQFEDPDPTEDEGDSGGTYDGLLGLVLGVASASAGPWADVGAKVMDYILSTSSSSDPVSCSGVTDYTKDGNSYQKIHWDIDLKDHNLEDGYPDAPCRAATARFELNEKMADGTDGTFLATTRYTFNYQGYYSDYHCPCGDETIVPYTKTTPKVYNYTNFTVK